MRNKDIDDQIATTKSSLNAEPGRYVTRLGLLLTLPFVYVLLELLLLWAFDLSYPWRTPTIIYISLLYDPFIAIYFLLRCKSRAIRTYSWAILVVYVWWIIELFILLNSGSCC